MNYQILTFQHSQPKLLKLASRYLIMLAFLTGCTLSSATEPPFPAVPIIKNNVTPLPIEKSAPANNLEVKIGQMLLIGFRGLTITSHDDPIVQDIRDRHIGGVVLFDYDVALKKPVRNIQSPSQVKALVKALQAYSKIPLLIGIDYEGGIINRLPPKYGFPATRSHQHLGQKNDLALTRQQATRMAKTLARLGVNLNFAPVVDLNTNPNNPIIGKKRRSFSADPKVVTQHALEFIRAHHQQHVLCTLKHFPGHGSSTTDSHLGVTDITKTWSNTELIPYQNLIHTGKVDAIMTAHVFNQKLDPKYPATLSNKIITHLLRDELKFNGVVFSDDMQMRAIANYYGLETAIRLAIEAGVDILVFGNNTWNFDENIASHVTTIIKRLIQKGLISTDRIDESYRRIQRLKRSLVMGNE